jgi:hypothetical protein
MKLVKIFITTVVSFAISLVLAFFVYMGYVGTIQDCGFGCGFGMAFAALFYIPVIGAVITLPVYLILKRLFRALAHAWLKNYKHV